VTASFGLVAAAQVLRKLAAEAEKVSENGGCEAQIFTEIA